MHASDDHILLAAAQAGDRDAMERLWERHRRWIAAVLLLHKPRDADLEDLLQEVATTIVSKIHSLRDPATLPGWLRSVALNAARMAARGTKRRIAAVERFGREEAAAGRLSGVAPRVERDAGNLLRGRLASLPSGYAEPLLLRLVHDLSYAQIAEILELPETTIENRIVRGRRMLREQAATDLGLNEQDD